ncbi:colicin transporter [Rhodanobacter sp. Root627]|uniref:tetratricopeptide repeat protein n=1 Tax=Rhodanobacter sp. Root627 TaxID=1736572 RepID=UPI0006FFC6BE|nr:tetratricopeptide repeat protein [Rhodanobacter sp. Root627]KRA31624.1 colicin transporter [Rhodanobacter sp. Root627]
MNQVVQNFHFLQPWWLAALLLLPLCWWLGARRGSAQRELSRLVDAELLPHLLQGRAGSSRLPLWLFAAGWTLAALAMAGPTWSQVEQPLYAKRAAQVVAISLSQRMLAQDVAPSRIARARFKVHDLLASNRDGLNALIGYAGEAFVVAPLTTDVHSLDDLLDAMAPDTMPVDGNDAARAIERGMALIKGAKVANASLVLVTDQADDAAQTAARAARAAGVRVSVLGVGTAQGGPVPLADGFLHDAQGHLLLAKRDDAALAALAAAGGGNYVPMSADGTDVQALHGLLRTASGTVPTTQKGDQWQDQGAWLLLPLLLIAALAFRRGWLLLLPLILLPCLPTTAQAGTWQDWWQRPDQQAAQALQQGKPKQAQQLARDPQWRGAAAYRAGDYAAATKALEKAPGSDAAYNLGNALARQGQYPQAIEAYDRALKIDPANADAEANRKAVEDWLRQQQKKPPSDKSQPQAGKQGDKSSPSQNQNGQGQNGQDKNKQENPDSSQGSDGNPPPKSSEKSQEDQDKSKPEAAKPAEKDGQNADSDAGKSDQQDKAQDAGKDADNNSPDKPASPPSAEQKARAEQAQQALKQQMDDALAGSKKGDSPPTHQLGAVGDEDASSKLPADLRQALQRVPDDPGALLRRKFELEYQQRHGGASNEDAQP